jgi:peptidoglycan/xylan/chitin deacetylase (PgdA/CDA1 family)
VIISFDGALHNEQWERSRALARETGARFTYFLSCVYLVTRADRAQYQPPDRQAGASNVGFGYSREDVAARLAHIWEARGEGHEIASHGCGHFDGGDWTAAQWTAEFAEFDRILGDAWAINGTGGEPDGWREFAASEIRGFRAPYLSTGPGLFDAIAGSGMIYDASTVSRGPQRPDAGDGPIRFALPMIPEGPRARPVIAMDYNLFVRHSGGDERYDKAGAFEQRSVDALTAAFEEQFRGQRIPFQVGMHFTLMNGGAYWNALERFARDVCLREGVECVSYADAVRGVSD